MRAEYFFGFTVSAILGVAIETTFSFGWTLIILLAFLALIVFLLRSSVLANNYSFIVIAIILGCAVGVLSVNVSKSNRNNHALDGFEKRLVKVEGVISAEPDVRESNTNVVIRAKIITTGSESKRFPNGIYILAHVPLYPALQYGDKVSISGKIAKPKNFAGTPGERPFDYRAYLAKDDIYYEMSFSKVSIEEHGKGNWMLEKLLSLKQILMGNIARVIPEPESSLAGGIVLGTKQSLGKEWIQKFRDAGLAHIVVLSGYNIAVVASTIARAISFLPFAARLGSSALGIVLFAMMVGGSATVLRATLMALVVILARAMGRESEALRVLVFVGWVMVMINPAILLSDVSFQLSFMAALALVVLAPLLETYFMFVKSKVLREILVTTIATQIFVAPILLYQMGNFSLVGLLANLFVLPLVPPAMLLVSIVALLAPIPLLGTLIAFPAQLLLSYILFIVQLGAQASFANIHIASFGIASIIVVYGIIFIVCNIMKHRQIDKKIKSNE